MLAYRDRCAVCDAPAEEIVQGRELEVVALNDLTSNEQLAYLLKFDSNYGRYPGEVKVEGDKIVVDGNPIKVTAMRNPATPRRSSTRSRSPLPPAPIAGATSTPDSHGLRVIAASSCAKART